MFCSRILTRVALWLGATLLVTPVRSADVLDTVRVANRLDLDASQSITASGAVPIPPAELEALLDPTRRPSDWKATAPIKAGPDKTAPDKTTPEIATPDKAAATAFHYRLAFKQPVELGAFTVEIDRGEGGVVAFRALKADAAYPGHPDRESDWETLATTTSTNRHDVPLPVGFAARALLVTQTGAATAPTLRRWQLYPKRLLNIAPYAVAQGDSGPFATDPNSVLQGGTWRNTGPDREGKYSTPPVSSVHPSWFTLVWDTPQSLVAARLQANIDELLLYAFVGDDRVNPAVAPDSDWQRIRFETRGKEKSTTETVTSVVFPAIRSRALKLIILETHPRERRAVQIREFAAFTDLADRPMPAPPSRRELPLPVSIPYRLPSGSAADQTEAAMVIEDSQGRRVRNLFAQVSRKTGENSEPWDLRDENGELVSPGTYRWKTISAPPLELHYRLTPYPNVEEHSPESSPWWTGAPQSGWLSNHGNQSSVCVIGDRVYQGAGGTEGGHALIETDFQGAKKWGTSEPAANLFTDGRTLFIRQDDSVFRFDAATKTRRLLFKLAATTDRKGAVVGMAAKNNKIYVAFHSPVPYLDNAGDTSMVDNDQCVPKLPATIKRSDNYGIPVAPQRDFLSLFRLGGHINGDNRANGVMLNSTKGEGRQQHIVLALKANMAIGSLVFPRPEPDHPDVKFRISVLKPSAPYPPQPNMEAHWNEIKLGELAPWNCVPAPPGTSTRALRLTFHKPGDALTDALDFDPTKAGGFDAKPSLKRDEWFGRIEGLRILRMGLQGLAKDATVRVNSGTIDEDSGEWDAQRTEVLSEKKPAIYALEWDSPRKLRGLAIKEIDGARTEIDVYEGAAGEIDISATAGWRHVATYHQPRRNFYQPDASNNAQARYLDGVVDFLRDWETRAVRLRIVSPWREPVGRPEGVRVDRGGRTIDPARCRVYGVTPVSYVGGEPPVDRLAVQRMEIYDADTGKREREVPSSITGAIAFGPSGALFGIRDNAVVTGSIDSQSPFIADLEQPRLVTLDGAGRLYVYDHGPGRRVVRVYDAAGKYTGDIGRPGPQSPGPYDPARFGDLCAISTDAAGDNIWMVYPHEDPRRVMRFKTDGTFLQDYFGGANYGGGGVLDPYDKSRFWFKNMLFKLDWDKGTTRLQALVSMNRDEASVWGGDASFRLSWMPIKYQERLYLVSAPHSYLPTMAVGSVYLFDEKTATTRLVAALGAAEAFPYVRTVEAQERLGGKPFGAFNFLWSDRNGDGQVQLTEVDFTPRGPDAANLGPFARDLSVQAGNIRYEVAQWLADGTPVFNAKQLPFPALLRLNNGDYFRFGDNGQTNEVITPQGERVWSYKAQLGMNGLIVPPWSPGVVDLQFGISGHAVATAGDLGEFFVIHANNGQMNLWTADGLLAGHITLHTQDPRARGWPNKHQRGLRLDGLSLGQEHFHHYFCRTEQDGKYYIVGGSTTVIEVKGIDRFARASGDFQVTPTMLEQMRTWDAARVRNANFAQPRIIDCPLGAVSESSAASALPALPELGKFRIGHDANHLYLQWTLRTDQMGPFTNGGDDFRRAFKTGACVDFHLGTEVKADPQRTQPAAGDLRVLVTVLRGKPTAILYRPVAPGAAPEQAWSTTTAAGGTTSFDQVAVLKDAVVTVTAQGNDTVVTATLSNRELGFKPVVGMAYPMDWGVLSSRDGNLTTARHYWANAAASGTTDEPTEARLTPHLWGFVRMQPALGDLRPKLPAGKEDIDDLLDIKTKKK